MIKNFIYILFLGDKGNWKYQIKGCAGSGGFAQVFKAFVDGNPEEVVALKVRRKQGK